MSFDAVVKELNNLNIHALTTDPMVWGRISREEADDIYNDVTHEHHEEWGTKSFNMLLTLQELDLDSRMLSWSDGEWTDCDPNGRGWRCHSENPKGSWCRECLYLMYDKELYGYCDE